jgi:hypothetical protein
LPHAAVEHLHGAVGLGRVFGGHRAGALLLKTVGQAGLLVPDARIALQVDRRHHLQRRAHQRCAVGRAGGLCARRARSAERQPGGHATDHEGRGHDADRMAGAAVVEGRRPYGGRGASAGAAGALGHEGHS